MNIRQLQKIYLEGMYQEDDAISGDVYLNIKDPKGNLTPQQAEELDYRIITGKRLLEKKSPFLSDILSRMHLIVVDANDPVIQTMAVDPWGNIYVNPKFGLTLNENEFFGVFAHECLHIANLTFLRESGRNPKVWNIATDAVMNAALTSEGYALPKEGIIPEADGTTRIKSGDKDIVFKVLDDNGNYRSAEEIYEDLLKLLQEQAKSAPPTPVYPIKIRIYPVKKSKGAKFNTIREGTSGEKYEMEITFSDGTKMVLPYEPSACKGGGQPNNFPPPKIEIEGNPPMPDPSDSGQSLPSDKKDKDQGQKPGQGQGQGEGEGDGQGEGEGEGQGGEQDQDAASSGQTTPTTINIPGKGKADVDIPVLTPNNSKPSGDSVEKALQEIERMKGRDSHLTKEEAKQRNPDAEKTQEEMEEMAKEVVDSIKKEKKGGRKSSVTRGTGAGGGIRDLLMVLVPDPPVNWRKIVDKFLKDSINTLYRRSWTAVNRRALSGGYEAPGRFKPHTKKLECIFAVDTSGSIGTENLGEFMSYIGQISSSYKEIDIKICLWHSQAYYLSNSITSVTSLKAVQQSLQVQSGGTVMSSIKPYILNKGLKPSLMIYLTDGYVESTPDLIRARSLFIVCNAQNKDEGVAKGMKGLFSPYGEVVVLPSLVD